VALALGTFALPSPAVAQGAYPEKPIRLIVSFPPGGSTDIIGRLVAQKVSMMWGGKSIVVENKAGASGTIGTGESIAAAPDGYTLTIGNSQTHGTNATLFPKLPYDLVKDVTPIAMLARTKNVLVVAGSSPYKTVADLLKAGKTKPLSYASVGNGASSHIIGEFITRKFNLNAVHVPYKGGAPALVDLMGGQVDFMAATYGSVANLAKDGRLRILAVSDDERDPRLPGVPTFKEAGLPVLGLETTIGIYGPAGLPPAIVNQWSDAIARVAKMPDVDKTLESAGFDVWFKPASEMATYHRQEVPRLGKVIKEANVEMN
ncbi:MAG: tripartite tricarboxylate transporter substrate binding protein, partial [Betaproteobacteria bacterium]